MDVNLNQRCYFYSVLRYNSFFFILGIFSLQGFAHAEPSELKKISVSEEIYLRPGQSRLFFEDNRYKNVICEVPTCRVKTIVKHDSEDVITVEFDVTLSGKTLSTHADRAEADKKKQELVSSGICSSSDSR